MDGAEKSLSRYMGKPVKLYQASLLRIEMSYTLPDNAKGRAIIKALTKPSRKRKVEEAIPDGFVILERTIKRVEALERLYRQQNKLLIEYVDEMEKLKNGRL